MTTDISTQIVEFVTSVLKAMGAMPRVESSESGETLRIDVEGEGAEALLFHRGEGLRALQTLVNTAFRRQLGEDRKVVVDCQGFRRDKDAELRQMAEEEREREMTRWLHALHAVCTMQCSAPLRHGRTNS